jgi:hypothetical protein
MSNQITPVLVRDDLLMCSDDINFEVFGGAQSVTSQSFAATSQTSTSHTYVIQVPNVSTIVDREILWTSQVQITLTGSVGDGQYLVEYGLGDAFAAFPLHQLTTNMTLQVNNVSTSILTNQVLPAYLRNMSREELQKYSMTPSYLDNYGSFTVPTAPTAANALGLVNNPLGAWGNAPDSDTPPRGSFNIVSITGNTVGTGAAQARTVVITAVFTEPLMISPLVFGDAPELAHQGFYGINQIQAVMQMDSLASRAYNFAIPAAGITKAVTSVTYSNSALQCRFLTASPSTILPEMNVIPYYQSPIFVTTGSSALASGASATIQSSNIQLSSIPDTMYIFARKQQSTLTNTDPDAYCTINSISINFNNLSGILASASQQQLWRCSQEAGSNSSWAEFSGLCNPVLDAPYTAVGTCGSLLSLKFGKHIPISEDFFGPSSLGNFQIQCAVNVTNNLSVGTGVANTFTPELVFVFFNSGVCVSQNGQSSIYTGLLNKQVVLDAKLQEPTGKGEIARMVGGKGFFSRLKAALPSVSTIAKVLAPVAKKHLAKQDSKLANLAAQGLEAIGYGGAVSGGAMSGAAISGGMMMEGGKKARSRRVL